MKRYHGKLSLEFDAKKRDILDQYVHANGGSFMPLAGDIALVEFPDATMYFTDDFGDLALLSTAEAGDIRLKDIAAMMHLDPHF